MKILKLTENFTTLMSGPITYLFSSKWATGRFFIIFFFLFFDQLGPLFPLLIVNACHCWWRLQMMRIWGAFCPRHRTPGHSQVAAYVCHMHNGTHKSFCKDLSAKTPRPGRRLCFWKIVYFIWVAPNEKWPWNIAVLIMLGLRCNQRRKKCQSNKSLAKQGRSIGKHWQGGGSSWISGSCFRPPWQPRKKNTRIYSGKLNEEYIFFGSTRPGAMSTSTFCAFLCEWGCAGGDC